MKCCKVCGTKIRPHTSQQYCSEDCRKKGVAECKTRWARTHKSIVEESRRKWRARNPHYARDYERAHPKRHLIRRFRELYT